MYRNHVSIGTVIYLLIGVIIAANRGYLGDLTSLSAIVSALLAIVLWPLLLFGISLHVTIGAVFHP